MGGGQNAEVLWSAKNLARRSMENVANNRLKAEAPARENISEILGNDYVGYLAVVVESNSLLQR